MRVNRIIAAPTGPAYSSPARQSCIMSDSGEDSDDDDWQYIEKVIEERKSDDEDNKEGLSQKGVEEVLNIDDFFGVEKKSLEPDADNLFAVQRAIENSLNELKTDVSSSAQSSSSSKRRRDENVDDSLKTPIKNFAVAASSSSQRSKKMVMKYHNSGDQFNLINLFSDEVLIHMLGLADYTTQRVCRRWSVVQIKVSRLKIVETLTTVSLLSEKVAGRVEYELFQLCSEKLTKQFRQRARSLIHNLRGNEELRRRVSEGSLEPSHLVRMESSETATKHLVQQREGEFDTC